MPGGRLPAIGRTPPAVTLIGGVVADSPLLGEPDVDAVAVPVAPAVAGDEDEGPAPRRGAASTAFRYGIDLADLAERAGLTGASGESFVVQLPRPAGSGVALPWDGLPHRIVLVGIGSSSDVDLRRAGAALARASRGLRRVVTTIGDDAGYSASQAARAARALVEGYLLAAYVPPTAARKPATKPAAELVLLGRDGTRVGAAVEAARTAASATWLVRDLASTPSSTKNPAWLAEQARRLASGPGFEVTVRGPRELAAEGFGGILAVGAGSASPPRLVTVTWTPPTYGGRSGSGRHVVIVGKGITYDTGGLSIKPREAMVPMKTDMTGAAVALATVLGAAPTAQTELKNIADPIRVYSLEVGAAAQASPAPSPAPAEKPAPPRLSIVVLPFTSLGVDLEHEMFVDGVTESLTTDLSRINNAVVVSRNTASTYKGKSVDAKQIGRELNVRYVLEGSIQRGGNRMRVNVAAY